MMMLTKSLKEKPVGIFLIASGVLLLIIGSLWLIQTESPDQSGIAADRGTFLENANNLSGENNSSDLIADQATTPEENSVRSADSLTISTQSNIEELSDAFRNAASARQAQEVVQLAMEAGHRLAHDWQVELDQACLIGFSSTGVSESGSWHQERLARFCDGFEVSEDFSAMDEVDLFNYYDQRRQSIKRDQLLEDLDGLADSEASSVLNDYLRSAEHPEDIQAAINLLSELYDETGASMWDSFGLLEGALVDQYRVQATALSLYSCYQFGNCGPDSMIMLSNCSMTPVCEPHWSYEDLLQYGMSPLEFELVSEIVRRLRGP